MTGPERPLADPTDHPLAAPARAWFETLRDRLCAAFEAIEDEAETGLRRPPRRPPGGPLRAHGMVPSRGNRPGRRRGDEPAAERPRVREGGRERLHGARRVLARIPRPDPRRRHRSALLRHRHLAGRPPAEPARAGGAHEHPLHRHHARLVRRRRRHHAHGPGIARSAGRRRPLPRSLPRRLRPPRPRLLPALQGVVRRVLLPAAPRTSRAAWAASSSTGSATARRDTARRPTSPSPATSASPSSKPIPPSSAAGCASPGRRRSAATSSCAAAATWSSTCSTTAARCSASRPAAMSRRS